MEKSGHSVTGIQEKFDLFNLINFSSSPNRSRQTLNNFQTKLEIFDSIKKLLFKNKTLEDLPRDLLELKLFSNYNVCEIHSHKKGSLQFKILSQSRSKELNEEICHDLRKFNFTFNQIKKSKNKLFEGNQFSGPTSSIYGTFLARVHEFKQHNVIIILSNNGFLFPVKEEQNLFDLFFKQFDNILESRISTHSSQNKYKNVLVALEKIPLNLEIINNDKTIIFKNTQESQEEGKLKTHEVDLSENKSIVFYDTSEKWATDILHFHRIKLLGELLNTLKHELSNPLFGIKLSSSILYDELKDIEDAEFLEQISKNCQRCQNIIQDFQYLYDEKNEDTLIDLDKLIREVVTLTKSETKCIPKDLKLEKNFKIKTNPTFLTQILFNLIINSAHAIEESGPGKEHRITIDLKQSSKEICISIKDTGIGIPEDKIETIFDPFFTTKEKGTGLGLPICQNLAKKLGGYIDYKNNTPLPGVTFSLHLTLDCHEKEKPTYH